MISARHTINRQSFKKVTCPFKPFKILSQALHGAMLALVARFFFEFSRGNKRNMGLTSGTE